MNQIKLIFVGDICIGKSEQSFSIDKSIEKIFKNHDIVGCNFEGSVISKANPISKVGATLSQSSNAAGAVKSVGFNLINLANNHIFDYGRKGLVETIKSLKNTTTVGAGINFKSAYSLKTVEIKSLKIGFLSFGESEFGAIRDQDSQLGGFAWINHYSVEDLIRNSKTQVDILIVQVHAGIEEVEIPLPEWRMKYKNLIDWGADAVVAHHPHIPQGWEKYKGKMIFYSLGNFYFNSSKIKTAKWGLMTSLMFEGKQFKNYKVIAVETNGNVIKTEEIKYKNFIRQINFKLNNTEKYIKEINSMCVNLWHDRYKKYYYQAMGGLFGPVTRKINSLLLLHNLRIESHRWLVERALVLMNK